MQFLESQAKEKEISLSYLLNLEPITITNRINNTKTIAYDEELFPPHPQLFPHPQPQLGYDEKLFEQQELPPLKYIFIPPFFFSNIVYYKCLDLLLHMSKYFTSGCKKT